jgi:predicted enzyme related to lactoylglutathione lyase
MCVYFFFSMTAPQLRNIIFLLRNVNKALPFYTKGIGLKVLKDSTTTTTTTATSSSTTPYVELDTGSVKLILMQTEQEASATCGYSPLIHFEIQNMDETIVRLLQLGGRLDGPIQHEVYGKLVSLRAPEGPIIGLYEPATA